ncbi:MAG: ribulose-bisphosphate carboxylase large subunit, partial [Candidatus Nanohaloarchaea archaeon]|nr:ribulose-bisphosphate carboxylase large subunit [Candidatus Nanohaloarchaea archaeon]
MTDGMEYEDFVDETHDPGEEELVCDYYLEHVDEVDFGWAAGAVAAESSVGTWEPGLATMNETIREKRGRVFRLEEDAGRISVAY